MRGARWDLRYPLSYQDAFDLLAEHDVTVERSTHYRWVQKFGPEWTKRQETLLGGIETIRTIERASIHYKQPDVRDEISFIGSLCDSAA